MVDEQIEQHVLPGLDPADRDGGRAAAVGILRGLVARRALDPVAFAGGQLLQTVLADDPAVLSLLAMVYWLAELDDRAQVHAARALEVDPEQTRAFFEESVSGGVIPEQAMELLDGYDDEGDAEGD